MSLFRSHSTRILRKFFSERPEVIQSLLNFSFNFFLKSTINVPLDLIGNKTGNPVHNSMTLDIDINSSNGDFQVGQDRRTTFTIFNFIGKFYTILGFFQLMLLNHMNEKNSYFSPKIQISYAVFCTGITFKMVPLHPYMSDGFTAMI